MKKMLVLMFVVSMAAACGKKQAPANPTPPPAPAEGTTPPAGEGTTPPADGTTPPAEGAGGDTAPK